MKNWVNPTLFTGIFKWIPWFIESLLGISLSSWMYSCQWDGLVGKFWETPMNFMGKFLKIGVRGSIFPTPIRWELVCIVPQGGAPKR
jgi:hypothetical protein